MKEEGRSARLFDHESGSVEQESCHSRCREYWDTRIPQGVRATRGVRETFTPGFPFCLSRMAPLYTRPPPSARNSVRRTISRDCHSARADVRPIPPSTPALRARSASSFFGGEPSPGRPTNIVNTRLRCPGGVRRDAPAVASCRPRITHVRHGAHRRPFAVAHSPCLSRPPERMWTDAACPRPPPQGGPESMTPPETGSTGHPRCPQRGTATAHLRAPRGRLWGPSSTPTSRTTRCGSSGPTAPPAAGPPISPPSSAPPRGPPR